MISIIGAGPVGNYLAYQLAAAGERVQVFEEHRVIGKPIQCTGITTMYLGDVMGVDESFVVNTIDKTRVFGPSGDFVEIPLKENYIVDRHRFDSYLGKMAADGGAAFHYGRRFCGFLREDGGTRLGFEDGKGSVATDCLVGADGPGSMVAKSAGMYGKRRLVVGVQCRMRMKEAVNPHTVDFYLGERHIGWVVPETKEICRVGVASGAGAKMHFDRLVAGRKGTALEWQSGMIPVYDPFVRTESAGVYLVGDAATMVKATTYGGIIPGMMASEELAKSILSGGSYSRRWRRRIGRELLLHLLMRKMMDRMGEGQLDKIVALAGSQRIKALIGRHDREFPSKILVKMALLEPRLAWLGLRHMIPF